MWTGGLPHLPGVPHLHVNRPLKEEDFKTTLTGRRVLKKHAAPSMFCWSRSPRKRKSPKKREPPRAGVQLLMQACHRPQLSPSWVNIVVSIFLNFFLIKIVK